MALYDDDVRYPDSDLSFKTIDLEIIQQYAQQAIARELAEDLGWGARVKVGVTANDSFNQIVIRPIVQMLAKHGSSYVPTGSESVPVTWWDHLLISIGLKRYAKTRTITTHATIYRTCPHLDVPIRNDGDRNMHLTYLMNVTKERGRRA